MLILFWADQIEFFTESFDHDVELAPVWPEEMTDVNLLVHSSLKVESRIILDEIKVRAEPAIYQHNEIVIPAALQRISYTSILLIIDQRILNRRVIRRFSSTTHVKVKERLILPESVATQLGFDERTVLTPGVYSLAKDRHFFHHFLNCETVKVKPSASFLPLAQRFFK